MTRLSYVGEHREGISADHMNMVKFATAQDRNYQKMMKQLRRLEKGENPEGETSESTSA
jgi:hypothetical protein